MLDMTLIVVDNFYENPDEIRDLALSLDFIRRQDATYPGLEAIKSGHDWSDVISKIKKFIPQEVSIIRDKAPVYPQGKFHMSQEKDYDTRSVGVHTDIPEWSAVIYLSKNPDTRGGTTWYKHIPTGEVTDSQIFLNYCFGNQLYKAKDEMREKIKNTSKEQNQWQEIQHVAMVYNRMIIFRADYFHATNFFFGNTLETGRLSQHFIFYTVNG